MKNIVYFLALVTILSTYACNKKEGLDKLSQQDKLELEGMISAFKSANYQNNYLTWCEDTSNHCEDDSIKHCDSLFHHFNSEYDEHHNSFDHHNMGTDEQHHGNMGHHNDPNSNEFHGEMLKLRETHKNYHLNKTPK